MAGLDRVLGYYGLSGALLKGWQLNNVTSSSRVAKRVQPRLGRYLSSLDKEIS